MKPSPAGYQSIPSRFADLLLPLPPAAGLEELHDATFTPAGDRPIGGAERGRRLALAVPGEHQQQRRRRSRGASGSSIGGRSVIVGATSSSVDGSESRRFHLRGPRSTRTTALPPVLGERPLGQDRRRQARGHRLAGAISSRWSENCPARVRSCMAIRTVSPRRTAGSRPVQAPAAGSRRRGAGRLIEQEHRRLLRRARPSTARCCSPPDSESFDRWRRKVETLEHLGDGRRSLCRLDSEIVQVGGPPQQHVILDGHLREDDRVLGHVGDQVRQVRRERAIGGVAQPNRPCRPAARRSP